MDRRSFLKVIGVGVGAVALPGTPKAAGLDTQVSSLVLDPRDIIKDPMIGPVFDMNDDVTGLAGHFTGQLLIEHMHKYGLNPDSAVAMLRWGLRQSAVLGLMLAKSVVTIAFNDGELVKQIHQHEVFKEMYNRYGELLSGFAGGRPTTLAQYNNLSPRGST